MSLQLRRPLVIFDIEATGTDVARDRIVEIALVRIEPSGAQSVKEWRMNPEMPIPPASTAVHGISDHHVKEAPTFRQLASELREHLSNVDLGGYNARRFDVPMLECEFVRVGMASPFDDALIIDAQEIFFSREPRTLVGAVRFYCQEDHIGAHGAKADAVATAKVLSAQLARYPDLPHELEALVKLVGPKERYVDPTQRFKLDERGEAVFNFGKYRGEKLAEMVRTNRDYLKWMLAGDWHPKVLDVLRKALEEGS